MLVDPNYMQILEKIVNFQQEIVAKNQINWSKEIGQNLLKLLKLDKIK
mgnify:CR=1 FL=1